MTRNGRILRRGGVAAAAAITALAAAAPGATAAANAPDAFAATGEALALELNVTAPGLDAVNGAMGEAGNTVQQRVSFTAGELTSAGPIKATSTLLQGLVDAGAVSSSDGQSSGRDALAEQNLGLVDFGVGTVEYATDRASNLTRSFSELANLNVTLRPLFDGSAGVPTEVTQPVQDAVQTATGVVNGLVGELNGALDQVEQQVEANLGEHLPIPDVELDMLPPVPDVTTVDLVSIRKMWSESVLETVDGVVKSTTQAGIIEASLLGGLVTVPTFQYDAFAVAGGTPGTADAGCNITDVAVNVAGTEVAVRGDQLTVGSQTLDLSDLNSTGLPAEEALAPVRELLAQVLDAAGLSISRGTCTTDVAPDGTSATAEASAFALRVRPLHAASAVSQDLGGVVDVSLKLLPVRAAASAGVEPAPAPPAPAPEPEAPPALPRTGGGALAMVLGVLGMGGAAVLRRGIR